MDKFDKHMAKPKIVVLKNEDGEEDSFTIYPLSYKYTADVFKLLENVSRVTPTLKDFDLDADIGTMPKEELEKIFSLFDRETLELLGRLEYESLKISYPEEFKTPEKQQRMERFVANNLFELFTPILELNTPRMQDTNRMKQLQEEMKKNDTFGQSKTLGKNR